MFVARRVPVDVIDLFVKISLHAAAYRRIKLSEVADLHGIVIPSEAQRSRGIPRNNLTLLPPDPSTPLRMTRGARRLRSIMRLHFAQILLRLQCRGATHSRSCNRLLVNAVSHVAGDEDAGNFTFDPVFREQIALSVHVEFASVRLRVGIVPDRDENARHFQFAFVICLQVAQTDGAHLTFFIGNVLGYYRVPDRFDLLVREHALLHDLRRPHLVAAMNEINL